METKIKEISRLQIVLTELNLVEIRRSEAENKVPSEFIKIAEAILNGHFLVTNGYGKDVKVYPTCVELYWHEEQGDIKDYIVYHRNSKKTKPVIFTHGILHNHKLCRHLQLDAKHTDIIIDDGNIVKVGSRIIMTEKVFAENPQYDRNLLIRELENLFECELLFLPWDKAEKYGHSDGIVKAYPTTPC